MVLLEAPVPTRGSPELVALAPGPGTGKALLDRLDVVVGALLPLPAMAASPDAAFFFFVVAAGAAAADAAAAFRDALVSFFSSSSSSFDFLLLGGAESGRGGRKGGGRTVEQMRYSVRYIYVNTL